MRRAPSRLFVALRFPDEVTDRLDDLAAEGLPGADWVDSGQYHLTLRFIGDPAPRSLDDVRRALGEVRAESFSLDLKGTGHFPLRGDPETLWAGAVPGEPLLRLRRRIESALTRAGIPPEGRKFHPHVSLARVRRAQPQHVAAFEIRHGLFRVEGIPVQEFHLCSSELRPEGAVHTVEETYGLEGLLEGEE